MTDKEHRAAMDLAYIKAMRLCLGAMKDSTITYDERIEMQLTLENWERRQLLATISPVPVKRKRSK